MSNVQSKSAKAKIAKIGGKDGITWNSSAQSYPNFPVPKGSQEVSVIQSVDMGLLFTSSTTVDVAASMNFTLSQMNDVSSWTTCFDQYRIDEIEVWIFPEEFTSSVDSGLVTSVLDYDDSTNLASLAAALDYDTAVTAGGSCGHYRRLKPRIAIAAYSGAFSSFANQSAQWIDCGSTGVQHYGLKAYATVANQTVPYRAIARFHVKFRALR